MIKTGSVFGRWNVIIEAEFRYRNEGRYNRKCRYWTCRCKCGTIKDVDQRSLLFGDSKGCRKCMKHRPSRLSQADVNAILLDSREQAEIAQQYNISRAYVGKIKQGNTHPHLERKSIAVVVEHRGKRPIDEKQDTGEIEKYCSTCNKILKRKRYESGKLESPNRWKNRLHCDASCAHRDISHLQGKEGTWSSERRQAARERMRQRWADGAVRQELNMHWNRTKSSEHDISDEKVRAIIVDPRKYVDIGKGYEISGALVSLIKQGKSHHLVENNPTAVTRLPGQHVRKFTDDQVRSILLDTRTNAAISVEYQVDASCISRIRRRLSYGSVV